MNNNNTYILTYINTMSLAISLPDELLLSLLEDWMSIHDNVMLNSAICNSEHRENLLLTVNFVKCSTEPFTVEFFRWYDDSHFKCNGLRVLQLEIINKRETKKKSVQQTNQAVFNLNSVRFVVESTIQIKTR